MTEINPLHRVGFALWVCFVVAFWGTLGFGIGFDHDLPPHYGTAAGSVIIVGFILGFWFSIAGICFWAFAIHLMLASFTVGYTVGILL